MAELALVLAVAVGLGLRHASDPDHLAAVSTLIASEPEDGTRRAGRLGLAWDSGTPPRWLCSGCRSCSSMRICRMRPSVGRRHWSA